MIGNMLIYDGVLFKDKFVVVFVLCCFMLIHKHYNALLILCLSIILYSAVMVMGVIHVPGSYDIVYQM